MECVQQHLQDLGKHNACVIEKSDPEWYFKQLAIMNVLTSRGHKWKLTDMGEGNILICVIR